MISLTPRNMRTITTALLVLLCIPALSADVKSFTIGGFLTGNDYRRLNDSTKLYYAAGLYDGMRGAAMLGASPTDVEFLRNCFNDAEATQVVAVLDRYVDDHPSEWHYSMNLIAYKAFRNACDTFLQ